METNPGVAAPASEPDAPPPAPAAPVAPPSSMVDWLTRLKAGYAALLAVAAAVLGLFAPERLVPEPLEGLRVAATLLAVLSLALTWAWRPALRRRLRLVTAAALALAAVLALLNANFVEPVEYTRDVTRYFLVGPGPVDPQFAVAEPAEIILQEGGTRATLRRIYGAGFTAVFSAYALCYVLLLPATVLAIGGTQLSSPRATRRTAARRS